MSVIDYNKIELEFVNRLRSADILSISERGVSTKTDSFTAAGGAEDFTLSTNNARNVRSVTQNSTELTFGTDYLLTYSSVGIITKVSISKSLTLNDAIVIIYDYGSSEAVYPDFPRNDIKISNYPRMGFEFVTYPTRIIAVNSVQSLDPRMQFRILDTSKEKVLTKMTTLRQWVKTNQQDLYYSNILRISDGSPYSIVKEQGQSKIYQMDLDVINELNIER